MADSPPASGIEGFVYMSPNRPGPLRKDAPAAGPAPHVAFVVKKEDATVASFTTDGEGGFRVALPAGHYVVLREDTGGVGHWRFEADVVAGQVTKIHWIADSGMR